MKIRSYKMLYYGRIDISQGIDPTKGNNIKYCMVCCYWFFNHGFKNEDSIFNGCHDLVKVKVLIIVVLLLTLANLRQFIH